MSEPAPVRPSQIDLFRSGTAPLDQFRDLLSLAPEDFTRCLSWLVAKKLATRKTCADAPHQPFPFAFIRVHSRSFVALILVLVKLDFHDI